MNFSKINRKKAGKWNVDLDFIITFYDAYVREKNLQKVAAVFEMRAFNLQNLINRYPELQQAKRMADENRVKSKLGGYAIVNLSPEARRVWDRLQNVSTVQEIELIFKRTGKYAVRLRQQLFCTAFLHSGYDMSKACSVVGIGRNVLNGWRDDLEFLQLLEEMQFHKKNFFENQLLALCHDLHPGAVVFANKTINADRGYSEKIEISHSGRVLGSRTDFDISDLDLDLETQKKVLVAIEKWKEEHGTEPEEDRDEEQSSVQTQAMTLVR